MPDATGWEGRIDLVPAEPFARWLCEPVLKSGPRHSEAEVATTKFSHYESPITIQVDELKDYVEERRGRESGLERLPILKWMGRIKAHGFRYILASQDATVGSNQRGAKLTSRR